MICTDLWRRKLRRRRYGKTGAVAEASLRDGAYKVKTSKKKNKKSNIKCQPHVFPDFFFFIFFPEFQLIFCQPLGSASWGGCNKTVILLDAGHVSPSCVVNNILHLAL